MFYCLGRAFNKNSELHISQNIKITLVSVKKNLYAVENFDQYYTNY